jgi:riboflavin kinase / FMN adenylyltransferase
MKFAGLDALTAQIAADVVHAKQYFQSGAVK